MTQIVEGFSLSHAQVLDGSTDFLTALAAAASEEEDIYGVNESSLDPDTGDYDNEGDDAVLSTWSWFNFADVTVQAGYWSFPLVKTLTGQEITTEGENYSMELWHEDSFNIPPCPMVVRIPSKDSLGAVRSLAIGLYRVQFKPITFDGPTYKDGLKINYNGRAVMSLTDETGQQFPDGKKRVGRVLSFVPTTVNPNPPATATGAVAGTPGTFTPSGAPAPTTAGGMLTLVADPATAWTEGQYVVSADGDEFYWDGEAWANGRAPAAGF